MNRHQSGSPSAWKLRRETYRKTSGPVSNPWDDRLRKKERRRMVRWTARARAAAIPETP